MNTYTIAIVGDGGVGKTTLLSRIQQNEFPKKYVATVGHEVHPDSFKTNKGDVRVNIADYAGQDKFSGDRSKIQQADAVIIMYSIDHRLSYKNVIEKWIPLAGMAPTVVVGNKADSERFVPPNNGLEISCKTDDTMDLLLVMEVALCLASHDPSLRILE